MSSDTNETAGALAPRREAYSVSEWCASVGISRAFFYKLAPDQRPAVIKLGRRSLITPESSAAWKKRMTPSADEQL